MSAAADASSEEAFRCAFGDGTAVSRSQLEWFGDCVEVEVSCD